jgi:15-cis-phytoene desaturase
MDTAADVIVVGGGLAGLSCAFELVQKDVDVLLLEARPWLGGRTASWIQDGMPVESGLHRYLGFYHHLPRLLRLAGVVLDDVVFWEDEVEIRSRDGPSGVFAISPLHRPIDTLKTVFSHNDLLPPGDKVALARFFTAGLAAFLARRSSLDRVTVRDYAIDHGVGERALNHLLVPLTAGLYFLPPERFSACAFFGLLASGIPTLPAMRLGGFRGGMTEVMCAPLGAAIDRRGGRIRTGHPVQSLWLENGAVVGVVTGGRSLRARQVVLATSLGPAQRLLAGLQAHQPIDRLMRLQTMPAVTIQLELDRPSMPLDRTTFGPGTALASFAEQSRTTFPHAPGRLSIILSPPERFLHLPPDEVLRLVVEDAAHLGLDLAGHVLRHRIVSEPDDFYALVPGMHGLRPTQRTKMPGLVLAGDYTRQRFMATMEGAVVSGSKAARLVASALRSREP